VIVPAPPSQSERVSLPLRARALSSQPVIPPNASTSAFMSSHTHPLSTLTPTTAPDSGGKSFNLNAALERLERQLQHGEELDLANFRPTAFHITWPSNTADNATNSNDDTHRRRKWLSPSELLADHAPQPPSSKDFPAKLSIHRQQGQLGLLGFGQDVSVALEQGRRHSSQRGSMSARQWNESDHTAHEQNEGVRHQDRMSGSRTSRMVGTVAPTSARNRAPRLGSWSASGRGRRVDEALGQSRGNERFTGAKPKTAGESNPRVGPGSHSPPLAPAQLTHSAATYKPRPPITLEQRGKVSGPAPGSYYVSTSYIERHVPTLPFGGTQKTHSRRHALGPHATGAAGFDAGGPGYYELKDPHFGGEPKSILFSRTPRFPETAASMSSAAHNDHHDLTNLGVGSSLSSTDRTLGPGHYNATAASVGSIGSSQRDQISFAARGSGSSAVMASAIGFKRSAGPSVGSYDPRDGGEIGGGGPGLSILAPSSSTRRPLHKFSSTPRFSGQGRPHPLYAMNVGDSHRAKQRQREMRREFRPNMDEFQAERRMERLRQQKMIRDERQQAAESARLSQRLSHLDAIDRIVHKDLHRAQHRAQKQHAALMNFVMKGWMFYVTLASRTQMIKENIRRMRTARNLRILTTKAARTIVRYARKWLAKARERNTHRAGLVILRALRRNIVRASLRRKRHAIRLVSILLLNEYNKRFAVRRIREYRSKAILIQRCWRRFIARREACLDLLELEWTRWEELLAHRYKCQEGEKAFEKIRKKGLMVKGMTMEQQKKKVIDEVPFDYVHHSLRRSILYDDYMSRLASYRIAKYEWREKYRLWKEGKLRPANVLFASSMDNVVSSSTLSSSSPPPSFDPHRAPYFRRLLPVPRVYSLLSTGQSQQSLARVKSAIAHGQLLPDPDERRKVGREMKRIIAIILKQLQAKEKKIKERERATSAALKKTGDVDEPKEEGSMDVPS